MAEIFPLPIFTGSFGYRGVFVMTILQSYTQGVQNWGADGMQRLWSNSTLKLIGPGVDDASLAEAVSALLGEEDRETLSYGLSGSNLSRSAGLRRQRIMAADAIRALPRGNAILLPTGARAALVTLCPWFEGPDADAIAAAKASAKEELRVRTGVARTR